MTGSWALWLYTCSVLTNNKPFQYSTNTGYPNKNTRFDNVNLFLIFIKWKGNSLIFLTWLFFFNWLFIVALSARSYHDCHWFSVLGMILYWYFFKLSSHKWDFSLSMADIYRAMSRILQATSDVNNHELRWPHLWATVRVQITLSSVGELKPPFWQQWIQFTRNCKH